MYSLKILKSVSSQRIKKILFVLRTSIVYKELFFPFVYLGLEIKSLQKHSVPRHCSYTVTGMKPTRSHLICESLIIGWESIQPSVIIGYPNE